MDKKKIIEGLKLEDAEIIVKYLAGSEDVLDAKGFFRGAQPMFSNEEWFMVLKLENNHTKFIPVVNIIEVEVIKAETCEIEDKNTVYHG